MNQIIICGNLGKDPEVKTTNGGTQMVKFSVATQHRVKSGEEWENKTTWHNVVAFGNRAEVIAKHFHKGDKILVRGRQEHRSFEGDDGVKKYFSEVFMEDFTFINVRSTGSEGPSFDDNEEIPF